MFAQAYAEFYAKGGTVKTLPGFDDVKPIPAYKPPRKRRKSAKPAEAEEAVKKTTAYRKKVNRISKANRAEGQEND